MHIPDGFLDTKTIVATSLFSFTGISLSMHRKKVWITHRQIPMMGLAAAFVFVAQMLNFPVVGGSSGHLIGAVLTAVLLGPSAAILVMTSVLVVQCFLFADGGVFALGANIFNMAIVGTILGYGIYRAIQKIVPSEMGKFVAIAFASWCSIVFASIFCAAELAWSGIVSWNVAFPAMANIHMLIGLGEGLITTLVIAAVWKVRPEILENNFQQSFPSSPTRFVGYGMLITIGLLFFIGPFVTDLPDGLEKITSTLGFDQKRIVQPITVFPIPNYKLPGITSPVLSTTIAGLIGIVVVFGLSFILARVLTSTSNKRLT